MTPGVKFVIKVTISMVNVTATSITISIVIVIIMITRPVPAYGRQGLAGLWGQDTDPGTFWGVVNISLCAFSAQLG